MKLLFATGLAGLLLLASVTCLAAPAKAPRPPRATGAPGLPSPTSARSLTEVPEVEPNDTREQAQPFPCGSLLTAAALDFPGDADHLTFTVDPGEWITLRTQDDPGAAGPQAGDLKLTLLDAAGNVVGFNDDWGEAYHARIVHHSLGGGTYVARIEGYDELATTGAYQVWLTCTVESPPAHDGCDDPVWIECGPLSIAGDVSFAADDFDLAAAGCDISDDPTWTHGGDLAYAFQASGGDRLELTITTEGQLSIYVTDACGAPGSGCLGPVTMANIGTPPAVLELTLPSSGVYYLVIDSNYDGEGGPFTLTGTLRCNVVPARHRSWGAVKSIYR